nr:k(+) efflux antiporter 3, chloroplastic [Quercus suber]
MRILPSDPLFQTSGVVSISSNVAVSLHRSEARYILILGFFFGGIVLNQLGLFRDLKEVKILSEWGIVFLW